jgi:hypothetical protein
MTDKQLALSGGFQAMLAQAETLAKSGFLPKSVRTKEQALAIMTMSRELGIGMWAGFNGINVIGGKPTISPQLMLALIHRSEQLESISITGDDEYCEVSMTRVGGNAHIERFTIQSAAKLGLANKDNWKKQPGVMLKWRAVSACARVVFPDIIIGFYTPEEINPDLEVSDSGEIVDSYIEDAPQTPVNKALHWIDNEKARKAFWAYTKNDLGLTEEQVYEALGVDKVHKFEGDAHAAKESLLAYVAETMPPETAPDWAEGDYTVLMNALEYNGFDDYDKFAQAIGLKDSEQLFSTLDLAGAMSALNQYRSDNQ